MLADDEVVPAAIDDPMQTDWPRLVAVCAVDGCALVGEERQVEAGGWVVSEVGGQHAPTSGREAVDVADVNRARTK